MSDKAFARMMNQIAAQDEALRLQEARDQQRRALISKLRSAGFFVAGLALFASAYCYRAELHQFVSEKFLNRPQVGQIEGSTGEALKGIQAQAAKRDQVLSEITK